MYRYSKNGPFEQLLSLRKTARSNNCPFEELSVEQLSFEKQSQSHKNDGFRFMVTRHLS